MSKRAGEFVTLDDLRRRDRRRRDALVSARALARHDRRPRPRPGARAQSSENPVYYVQYAHARIVSMLAKAGEERVQARPRRGGGGARGEPLHAAERALIELLLAFPAEVDEAVERRAPHRHRRVRAGARAGLHRLLPRLPRARRRAGAGRVRADRAVRRERAHDRPLPGPARGQRAPRRCSWGLVEAREVGLQAGGVVGAERRALGSAGPARARAVASAAAAGRAWRAARGRPRAGRGRRSRSNPCALGSPSTAGPYWPTSACLICASSSPSSIRPWM